MPMELHLYTRTRFPGSTPRRPHQTYGAVAQRTERGFHQFCRRKIFASVLSRTVAMWGALLTLPFGGKGKIWDAKVTDARRIATSIQSASSAKWVRIASSVQVWKTNQVEVEQVCTLEAMRTQHTNDEEIPSRIGKNDARTSLSPAANSSSAWPSSELRLRITTRAVSEKKTSGLR